MGVRGLKKELRSRGLVHEIMLSNFSNKKIAVDISNFMYKFKVTEGLDWKNKLLKLIIKLREYNLHCTFVFDGKPPEDKDLERQRRREAKENINERVNQLKLDLENYVVTGEVTTLLRETNNKLLKGNKMNRLLLRSDPPINIDKINEDIEKKSSHGTTITREDTADAKRLLEILNIEYLQAPSEAESLAAWLHVNNKVDAIITEDTDVLCYGSEVYVSNIDLRTNKCEVVYLSEVLNEMNLSFYSFVDFCIMCSLDYNENVPKVGIKNAYKLMIEHENIDNWSQSNPEIDISMLRHIRCREIFKTYNGILVDGKPIDTYNTFFWGVIEDFKDINRKLIELQVKFSLDEIKDAWKPLEIIIEM